VSLTEQPVGLVVLFESSAGVGRELDGIEFRIGYLVAESLWGKGSHRLHSDLTKFFFV
jgi:hypothetical protein